MITLAMMLTLAGPAAQEAGTRVWEAQDLQWKQIPRVSGGRLRPGTYYWADLSCPVWAEVGFSTCTVDAASAPFFGEAAVSAVRRAQLQPTVGGPTTGETVRMRYGYRMSRTPSVPDMYYVDRWGTPTGREE